MLIKCVLGSTREGLEESKIFFPRGFVLVL